MTIDTKTVIKLWDVRSLVCLQTLVNDNYCEVGVKFGLVAVTREIFLTYGTRFKSFQVSVSAQNSVLELNMTEAERAAIKREKQARYVCYNLHYMMIVVVTLKEIKLYRMHDGFM